MSHSKCRKKKKKCRKKKCPKKCPKRCPKIQTDYFYTAVEGSIRLQSGQQRFIEFEDGDGCAGTEPPCPIWRCLRGDFFCHPDSFDPITGIFTAPSSNFYDVSLAVNYFYDPTPIDPRITGRTTTTLCRNLQENICGFPGTGFMGLDIAVLTSTNPFSNFGTNCIASAVINYCIPLNRGDKLLVMIFQENDQAVEVTMFAQMLVKRGKRIDPCIDRCEGLGCKGFPEEKKECHCDCKCDKCKTQYVLEKYGVA
uniref:Uncharacterized protein n=1 Tax=Pithovirus LCPAC103 TaxID=2506588 RepID=A0A481Z3S8_9VIRU|nr:MAG: hypothetical protein LCPAC103_01380 [Pithovirus LCPAC103]